MLNPNGERTPFTVAIITSGNEGNYACAAINHSDDSCVERTACAKHENLLDAVINCTRIALVPNIKGNWLNIALTTDSDYLIEMFGGKYRTMHDNHEKFDYQEIWEEIDQHLRAHHCKVICTKLGDMTEVAARAKATAEYYAPTAGLWTAVKPTKKRQPRKKTTPEAEVA